MKTILAWRILTHERGRGILAVIGIFVAVLLIFLQLGFFFSVPKGGMLLYDNMRFDLILASRAYVFQGQSQDFPRRRLFQAESDPDVLAVAPLYQDVASWRDIGGKAQREIFVMGIDLDRPVFTTPSIRRQIEALRPPDEIIVDSATRPIYGPLVPGRQVEIGNRTVTIAGQYELGTGFVGLGAALASDQEFLRLFPRRTLAEVNLGLVTLRPGGDPETVAVRLRAGLPADVDVYTREGLTAHEVAHWVIRTSTGLVFGFGVAVAFVVGSVILYQTLATQILRYMPQYAVLKAMGYTDWYLGDVVLRVAGIMSAFAFVPAVVFAIAIYAIVRAATLLPIEMTVGRLHSVLGITLVMAATSALVSIRAVTLADPVDLF